VAASDSNFIFLLEKGFKENENYKGLVIFMVLGAFHVA